MILFQILNLFQILLLINKNNQKFGNWKNIANIKIKIYFELFTKNICKIFADEIMKYWLYWR